MKPHDPNYFDDCPLCRMMADPEGRLPPDADVRPMSALDAALDAGEDISKVVWIRDDMLEPLGSSLLTRLAFDH
jgi:hypothetical protein